MGEQTCMTELGLSKHLHEKILGGLQRLHEASDQLGYEASCAITDLPHGHGDADRQAQWPYNEPPPGFTFIRDAECMTIAMVRLEDAEHFVRLLNAVEDIMPDSLAHALQGGFKAEQGGEG